MEKHRDAELDACLTGLQRVHRGTHLLVAVDGLDQEVVGADDLETVVGDRRPENVLILLVLNRRIVVPEQSAVVVVPELLRRE